MRRARSSEYVTIPLQDIEIDGSSLQPAEGLVHHKHAEQVEGSLAFEDEVSGLEAATLTFAEAEISYSLDRIAEDLTQGLVLLVDYGDQAIPIIRACAKAGLSAAVICTDDLMGQPYLGAASSYTSLGPVFSEAIFKNSYAILKAAEACGAEAILIIDPELVEDEFFLARCKASSLFVFKALDATNPYLGWALCESQTALEGSTAAWRKCPHCNLLFDRKGLQLNHCICPSCKRYLRMSSKERIKDVLDTDSFVEWWPALSLEDPLDFPGYLEKLERAKESTGLHEAVVCGAGAIAGMKAAFCFMDSQFFMASMGSVVGEKITRCVERATQENLPLIIFCASGGARMQEGLLSLMQMAKISFAIARHAEEGLLYISVLTDPTTGGVTASFAMQGDIVLAEPKALIGFAGQRVIKDTMRRELPEGFQTAEFALEHGLIDAIVDRRELRARLAELVALHLASSSYRYTQTGERVNYETVQKGIELFQDVDRPSQYSIAPHAKHQIIDLRQKPGLKSILNINFFRKGKHLRRTTRKQLGSAVQDSYEREGRKHLKASSSSKVSGGGDGLAWERVQLARNTNRPTAQYYIDAIVDGFVELHGDRSFADDGAILAGLGWVGNQAVTVVAEEKGFDLQDRIARNFGCPKPEGYRKSLRIMKQAEKFGRPIVCFVDTQGAFCGTDAEERGQGNAIAENLLCLSQIAVPVVSIVIGEGGSGGALALAVADRVAMQENAVYSILSPEGFASILWKDGSRAAEAASLMKICSEDALSLGIVDAVLSEGEKPAHENPEDAAASLHAYLTESLEELSLLSKENLLERRFERFRSF